MREARQVVERVHQPQHEIRLRLLPRLGALLERALAEVVVLGGEPEILVLEIRDLTLQAGDRLLRRLDQRTGPLSRRCRIRATVGRWALPLFIVHDLALLLQSMCRLYPPFWHQALFLSRAAPPETL